MAQWNEPERAVQSRQLDADWWVPGKGRMDWSLFLPPRALAENNLESFNYLGIGVLIGLCAAGLLCFFGFGGILRPVTYCFSLPSPL